MTHAVLADSTDQYATITDASQTGLDITGSMTISGWFRPDATSRWHVIAGKYDGPSNQRSYIFQISNTNLLRFVYSNDGIATHVAVSTSLTGYSTGVWGHCAAVFIAGTPAVQFYFNALPVGSPVAISGPGTVFNGSADFRVGNVVAGTASNAFEGRLDRIRIYNDERTDVEMWQDYISAIAAGANLQGGWELDNNFTDVSGNGNTLTNNGLTFSTAELPPSIDNDVGVLPGGLYIAGGVAGALQNDYKPASAVVGGGAQAIPPILYRMRGIDSTLGYPVYWNSDEVDTAGLDYGGPGPLTDIVLTEKLAE